MAMIRVEPVEVQVRTDWFDGRPARDHLGRRAPAGHAPRGRPRGGRRLPGHHRPADALRGRHAAGARRLTYQHRSRRWTITGLDEDAPGPPEAGRLLDRTSRPAAGLSPAAPATSDRGAGAPVPRPPRRRRSSGRGSGTAAFSLRAQPTIGPCTNPSGSSSFADLTLAAFVDRLASADPVPAAAARRRSPPASAPSLVAMVAALSEGRPRYAQHARAACAGPRRPGSA